MRATATVLLALLATGCKGERGDPGPQGPPGTSRDTELQVLEKLNQALAAGGSLDLQRSAVSVTLGPESFRVTPWSTRVPYSAVAYDKLGEFNPGVSSFFPRRSGEYLVCASLGTGSGGTALYPWGFAIAINDARQRPVIYLADTRTKTVNSGCRVVHLDASDFLQIWVTSSVPYRGGYTTFPRSNGAWLTIHRIG